MEMMDSDHTGEVNEEECLRIMKKKKVLIKTRIKLNILMDHNRRCTVRSLYRIKLMWLFLVQDNRTLVTMTIFRCNPSQNNRK